MRDCVPLADVGFPPICDTVRASHIDQLPTRGRNGSLGVVRKLNSKQRRVAIAVGLVLACFLIVWAWAAIGDLRYIQNYYVHAIQESRRASNGR